VITALLLTEMLSVNVFMPVESSTAIHSALNFNLFQIRLPALEHSIRFRSVKSV